MRQAFRLTMVAAAFAALILPGLAAGSFSLVVFDLTASCLAALAVRRPFS